MKRNIFAIFLTLTMVVALAFVVAPTVQAAEPTMVLEANTDSLIINEDTLLDLAGYNATVTVAEGKILSVIDSGNIGKEGTAAGTLTVAEGNKGTIAVEAEDANGKRYLRIAAGENTYSFHPFYLTVKRIGINTSNRALCLQAMFVTTEAAQQAVETGVVYGEAALDSAAPTFGSFNFKDGIMYAYYDLKGSLDSETAISTERSFQAYIQIGSDKVYSKTVATFSPKTVLETLNENISEFSSDQITKMRTMITSMQNYDHLKTPCSNFLGENTTTTVYEKINSIDELETGKYVIVCSNGCAIGVSGTVGNSATYPSDIPAKPAIEGTVATDTADVICTLLVSKDENKNVQVTITNSNGQTIGPNNANNAGPLNAKEHSWTVIDKGDGTFWFYAKTDTVADATTVLVYRTDKKCFATRKQGALSAAYLPDFTLYKECSK